MRERVRVVCFLLLTACGSSGGTPSTQDASAGHDDGSGDLGPDGASDDGSDDGSTPDGAGDGGDAGDGGNDGGDTSDGGDTNGDSDGSPQDGDAGDDGGNMPNVSRTFVYVGGWDWSNNASYPFRSYELDRSSGALSAIGDAVDLGPNPSFVTADANGQYLYVANEVDGPNGGVTVAQINRETGAISKIDHEQSTGADTGFVYTTVAPGGQYLLASSYSKGTVSAFPIQGGGSLGGVSDTLTVGGNAHSVRVSTDGKWAYVPNLGQNEINQLAFYDGQLDPNPTQPALDTGVGSGPRHIDIHPNGKWAYVMFEHTPRLVAYAIQQNGLLQEIDREETVEAGVTEKSGAHVLIHPNGKFVYVSNRNDTSIASFTIANDGTLSLLERVDSRGVHPRNFDIDSSGQFMVVANKGGDNATNGNLAVFRVESDGRLTAIGQPLSGLKEPTGVAIVNVF